MPSKIPPRSFRPGADRAAKMDAWAKKRGISSPSEALAAMVDAALGIGLVLPPTAAAVHSPGVGVNTQAQGSVGLKPHMGKDGVQVGPVRPPLGAMLDRKKRWRA